MKEQEVLNIFPQQLRQKFHYIAQKADKLQEIRLCVNQPVRVLLENEEYFLGRTGDVSKIIGNSNWYISISEMEQILDHICSYSRYAYEEEIGQGFITVPGGHRVGLSGQVILGEDAKVKNIKYIRCMNIRIAHEIKGAADTLLPLVYENARLCNILLIAPPGCGKTTMLRDLIRQVSNGNEWAEGKQIGVVDERSEIAGSYMGIPGNDLGIRTYVLDGCPKVQGMMMLLRSMAPQVIAVDEVGGKEDRQAIQNILRCGCNVIATMHGSSMEEVKSRGIDESMFERFVFLGKKDGKCALLTVYKGKGDN